jgi:hypothetical protein
MISKKAYIKKSNKANKRIRQTVKESPENGSIVMRTAFRSKIKLNK